MKNCNKIAKKAFLYWEGMLSGNEPAEINAHLQQCPHCAKQYDQARQIRQALHNLPKLKTSPHFTIVLHARMRQEALRRRSLLPIPLAGWSWQVPAYVLAVIVLVASGILLDRAIHQRNLKPQTGFNAIAVAPNSLLPLEQLDRTKPTRLNNYVMQPIPIEKLLRINKTSAGARLPQALDRRLTDTSRAGKNPPQIYGIRQVSAPVQF